MIIKETGTPPLSALTCCYLTALTSLLFVQGGISHVEESPQLNNKMVSGAGEVVFQISVVLTGEQVN